MRISDRIQVAWEGIMAYQLRALLTVFSVTVGVAALVAVISIGRGTRNQALAEFRELGGDMVYISPDPEKNPGIRLRSPDPEVIRNLVPEVNGAWIIELSAGVQVRYSDQGIASDIIGVPPAIGRVLWRRLDAGRFLSEGDQAGARRTAVIGARLADNLSLGSSAPGKILFLNGQPFEVSGVLARSSETAASTFGVSSDDALLVPIEAMRRVVSESESVSVMVIQGTDLNGPDALGKQVADLLSRIYSGAQFKVDSWQNVRDSFLRVSRLLTGVMALIAALAMASGGMGITNIMFASVVERTREIGVRRALGARRHDVFWQFLLEALLLAGTGGVAGVAFAWVPVFIAGTWIKYRVGVSLDAIGVGLGLALLLGVISGTWPAFRASRLEPTEALRADT